jgi:hypothetical protein
MKSFLDRASDKLARTIAQIKTGHWLCELFLKPIRKDCNEPVSDPICVGGVVPHTHVFLRCRYLILEKARIDIWDRPDENG